MWRTPKHKGGRQSRDRIAPRDPTVLMCDWHSSIRLQRYFFKLSLESKGSDLAVIKKIKFIEMAFPAAGNFGLSVKTRNKTKV